MRRRTALVVSALAVAVSAPAKSAMGTAPPADIAVVETTVEITIADHVVPATLALPAERGDEAVPAVLLLHGFASQKDEVGEMYTRVAAELAERGIASLRIDFAGTGDSAQPFTANTFDGMVDDAAHSFDWLAAQPEIDAERIGVLGFSNGAKVGLAVMVERPAAAMFASWSGALADGLSPGMDELRAEADANGSVTNDLGFIVIEMSDDWFTSMAASSPVADAVETGYDRPLLLIVGTDDTTVDPSVSQKFDDETNIDDTTFVTIEGADHIFDVLGDDQTAADEVIVTTADWFAARLLATEPA